MQSHGIESLDIDKEMAARWESFAQYAERQFKNGFVAGYTDREEPQIASFPFKAGFSEGYWFSQMRDQKTIEEYEEFLDGF